MDKDYFAVNRMGIRCKPHDGIFPILKQLGNDEFKLIGTAFFVTKHAVFLTARHVLVDVLDKDMKQIYPIIAILRIDNCYQICAVLRFRPFLDLEGRETDIAIGELANLDMSHRTPSNPFYGINHAPLKPGDEIMTFAYPGTQCIGNKINYYGKYYSGQIIEYYPDGRDRVMLPSPCYQTDMNILGGASGGPVFNPVTGCVIGINSTSFESNEQPHLSYVTDIIGFKNTIQSFL